MRSFEEIGRDTGTDKVSHHKYHPVYENHFGHLRNKQIVLLEIGVETGASLKLWEEYFPSAVVHGIDIRTEARKYLSSRGKIFIGDQADPKFLAEVIKDIGSPDIIIDDGGHKMDQQQISFQTLFPRLRPGGIYVIEDLQTSYLEVYHGGPVGTPDTTIEMLKSAIDGVQHPYHGKVISKIPESIEGIHVYRNICFINKKMPPSAKPDKPPRS